MADEQLYFEDVQVRYEGRIVGKSADPDAPLIICDLQGSNQDGQRTLTGRCTILLPRRGNGASA